MISKTVFITAIILLACLTLWTCKKDNVIETGNESDPDDETFCELVEDQNFHSTGSLIDDFLVTLPKGNSDNNLIKLKDWLESKSCVSKAEILCNSCIFTLPPQSELSVDFISNGQPITMTLDVLMDDPLEFRAYH